MKYSTKHKNNIVLEELLNWNYVHNKEFLKYNSWYDPIFIF